MHSEDVELPYELRIERLRGVACSLTAFHLDVGAPGSLYVGGFNLAFHLPCAYSAAHPCPPVPAQNRLPVRIEAGERLPFRLRNH